MTHVSLRFAPVVKTLLLRAVLVFGAAGLMAGGLRAQQQTAQVDGRVTDAAGASIPDALVTVTNPETGFSVKVKTNSTGDYTVPLLQPANHYQIAADREGFKETVQKDVALQVAQTAKINLTLQIGGVSEVVTVTSGEPILDAETSSIGQVITGQTVEDLPLNGRSTFRLIALTPGVTFTQSAYGQFGDVAINTTFDTMFTINGGRVESNEFLIDGVPSSTGFFDQITTIPTPDDTSQFKVEANNLSAQYGRYTGGVVNVTTNSGTNRYHGNVYEFFRNSALDANDWFNKRAGLRIPAFKLNIFGATFGGPLSIPKLYNAKDHTFFFVEYQGTQRTKGTPYSVLLPTDAQKSGDFSALCSAYDANGVCLPGKGTQLYNPFTTNATTKIRTPFAGNIIPAGLIDPVAQAIQKYFPEPNQPLAGGTNYRVSTPVRLGQDIYSARIDQNVSQKYHLFGRYAYSNSNLTLPNAYGNIADVEGAAGTTRFRNQSFAFDNIYSISPSLTLSVDYGFARWYQIRQSLSFGFDITTLGLPASLASALTVPVFPTVAIAGGYGGTHLQNYTNNGNDSHALLASVTKTAGRHTIIAGVDGRYHKINFFNLANSAGTYIFAQFQTQNVSTPVPTGGNAYASFLLGAGSSGTLPVGSGVKLNDFYGAVYVQDNWRVTQRLTLNLGVRYDGESPYIESRNRLSYFDPNIPSPLANAAFPALKGGLSYAGINGNSSAVYTRQHDNVAPRVGFAFSPDPTTVVRGGAGIAYGPLEISDNVAGFAPNNGYLTSTTWDTSNDGGYTPANLLRNPYPQGLVQPTGNTLGAATQVGQAISVWVNNPPTPRAYQYNFDVQQQLAKDTLLDLGYVGSRGLYLTGDFDFDTLNPTNLALGNGLSTPVPNPFFGQIAIGALANKTVAQRQLLLPYPQFTSVVAVNDPYGSSSYNSFQAKLVKRASNGLTVLVAYTWSKLISNANPSDAPFGYSVPVQNYYNLAAERSVSEIDVPQNFVLSSTYDFPLGRGKRFANGGGFENQLLGGFKLNTIWTEHDGVPLLLSAPITGIASGRPNFSGVNPKLPRNRPNAQKVAAWFNTAAFVIPPAYTFGNVGPTFTGVRQPGLQNVDASLIKDNRFEHVQTEFRAEFFNVLNNPHFSGPVTALNSGAYGAISSVVTSPPQREIQFALKISF